MSNEKSSFAHLADCDSIDLDELLELMWEKLNLRRVYTKPKGKLPDYTQPVVLRANACTVEDFVRPELLLSVTGLADSQLV